MPPSDSDHWALQRHPELPRDLPLETGEILSCRKVLRQLPGRRLVCAGRWRDKRVVAKVFMGRRAARKAARERQGAYALEAAGIPAPKLLLESAAEPQGWPVLLFEHLDHPVTLGELWNHGGEAREGLLQELLELVARQHRAGLVQTDLHPDNFLLTGDGKLWAVDAGGYRHRKRALTLEESIDNLGMLFAQFPRATLKGHLEVLDRYAALRGFQPKVLRRAVPAAADRWRRWRARHLADKAFRNCTEFLAYELADFRIHQRRDLGKKRLTAWLAAGGLAPRPGDRMLKAGNSQTVWRSRIGDREVVVKRYNLRGPWQRLRRTLGGSRAARAWRGAHLLRAFHIDTPRPLAYIEERSRGLLAGRSWLITDWVAGQPAHQALVPDPTLEQIDSLVETLRAFGDNGLVHGDMKASNFILDNHRVWVIDLDSLSWPRWRWRARRGHRADIRRFLRNWEKKGLAETMLLKSFRGRLAKA